MLAQWIPSSLVYTQKHETAIYVYTWLPTTPVARIAGQLANSNPITFTEDNCEGVEVCLQRPATNVKSSGSSTQPPKGLPQAVCRDDTQAKCPPGKPNSGGGNYRTRVPAGQSGCPL